MSKNTAAPQWFVDPEQYANVRLWIRHDELNHTNSVGAFLMRIFGTTDVEIVVTPDGCRPLPNNQEPL